MPGAGQVDPPRYAILVKIDVNKYILVWVVTVVVLFAIVAGIMVGILGRSPTLGAATSSGVIVMFAFVQAFLFCMYKRWRRGSCDQAVDTMKWLMVCGRMGLSSIYLWV